MQTWCPSAAAFLLLLAGWALPPRARALVRPPADHCLFATGTFDGKLDLAVFSRAANEYETGSNGQPYVLYHADAGHAVEIYRQAGAWTCGYVTGRRGAGSGWMRSIDLRRLAPHRHPALAEWTGTWRRFDDSIRIAGHHTPARGAPQLSATGAAYWHGSHTTHYGALRGAAAPQGNHLHLEDGACEADFTLAGSYLVVQDNHQCGGMNVTFSGVWKRAPRR